MVLQPIFGHSFKGSWRDFEVEGFSLFRKSKGVREFDYYLKVRRERIKKGNLSGPAEDLIQTSVNEVLGTAYTYMVASFPVIPRTRGFTLYEIVKRGRPDLNEARWEWQSCMRK